jgi:type II pantothenate kinase
MPAFRLLRDAKTYRPCPTDMLADEEFRAHWLAHFRNQFELVVRLAVDVYGPQAERRARQCQRDFVDVLEQIESKPDLFGELNLLTLDVLRQQKLTAWDLPDPFLHVKRRENQAMLALYPAVVAELDARARDREALLLAVEGVFAGNILDLGIMATAHRFSSGSVEFIKIRGEVAANRPWLVEHFDAFVEKMLGGNGYRKVVVFVDNAGSDCVLGVLPLARWMAGRGTEVVLAANDLPALNDVTHTEMMALLTEISKVDPVMARLTREGLVRSVNSGGIAPLIDLRHVSDELNRAVAGADLVMLEGMGRALESNFDAQFTTDSVKFCMIKDSMIAQREGGKIYDSVFRFDALDDQRVVVNRVEIRNQMGRRVICRF